MDGYRELSAPRVGQAVTAFIAQEFAGDRRKAERESVRRVARALGISDLRRWSADEITGFRRMAPMLACIPDLERWSAPRQAPPRANRPGEGLPPRARLRALASRHRRFRAAVEQLADQTAPAA